MRNARRWMLAGVIDPRKHFRIDGSLVSQEEFEIALCGCYFRLREFVD